MAWWNKAWSAAKSAVSKAASAVSSVANAVTKSISDTISKVSTAIKSVTNSAKKTASNAVSKVASSVSSVVNTVKTAVLEKIDQAEAKREEAEDYAKKDAEMKIEIASQRLIDAQDAGDAELIKQREAELKALQEAEPTWTGKLMDAVKRAVKSKLPFLGPPGFNTIGFVYEMATGKVLTDEEGARLQLKVWDWIVPLNTLSKLFAGKNLDGKAEEFGGAGDYAELALGLAMFIPAAAVGKVAGKLGSKGFVKLFATKSDDAVKLFKTLNVDEQAKMIRGLVKTDDGIKIVNRLLRTKSLRPALVKPTISIVNTKLKERILVGSGFGALIRKAVKPKTVLYGLTGLLGIVGLAYGIPFGTSWMAKEGIKEQFEIPLTDRMRDYRFEPTAEKREIILTDIAKLEEALPIAEAQIRAVAWLWPFTKDMWTFYADNIDFELGQYKKELEMLLPPELIELPDIIHTKVRDIIDGDTLDLDLQGTGWSWDKKEVKEIKLPEYKNTAHARVRLVGIDAPEKSPKGEIICTDIPIRKVEKKWADEARNNLLYLNDAEIELRIGGFNQVDKYGRILAVVWHGGKDIGLKQIEEGLACYYFREPHEWLDDVKYEKATLTAKEGGVGMWEGLEWVMAEEEKIKIYITSTPSNAKLYLDDIALRHNTPSDEAELSDVIHLFTPGPHILEAERAGMSAMKEIEIVKGDNGTIELILETAPLEEPPPEEPPPEEPPPEEPPPEEPPIEYTDAQEWALKEAMQKIWDLTKGAEVMSEDERETLIAGFGLYTDEQKEALLPLWVDLEVLTKGTAALSTDEFNDLVLKYQVDLEV